MNKQLLAHLQKTMRAEASRLEAIKPSCRNCVHVEGVHCTKFEAVPPPDVAAVGCDEWEWDQVPF